MRACPCEGWIAGLPRFGLAARVLLVTGVAWCGVAVPSGAGEFNAALELSWQTDYAATMAAAERDDVQMVVYFCDGDNPSCHRFDEELAGAEEARKYLSECRCVRLPIDAEITSGGKKIRLLEHPAFLELQGGAGLIVFDFATESVSQRGRVVRTLPFRDGGEAVDRALAFLGARPDPEVGVASPIEWMTDYAEATARAEGEERMLLVYFERADGTGGCAQFETETLLKAEVREHLDSYVCLKLSVDAEVNLEGTKTVLLKHPSFAEMVGLPGVAIVDYSDPKAPYFGQVVSTFPFLKGNAYDPMQMHVILTLPPGKLTQRTLIYAVRTHPESPQSTSGRLDPYLLSEAESHSVHQARIRLQGHHAWESRFHRITGRLGGGLLATEVCAESWPGQNLLEAALDCVSCWRQSSGHWRSVRSAHPVFAYDIRRGSNGIWYATGIFGKRGY